MRCSAVWSRRAIALFFLAAGFAGCRGGAPDTLPAPADVPPGPAQPVMTQPVVLPAATYRRPGGASATSALPAAPSTGYQIAPDTLAWSPDGTVLAYATRGGAFYLDDGSGERRIEGASLGGVGHPFVRWSPVGPLMRASGDPNVLLAGGTWFDGVAVFTGLWLVKVGDAGATAVEEVVPPSQVVSTVRGNTGAVQGVDWSPDTHHFAYPYRAEAWLASSGTPPKRLTNLTDVPLERGGASPPFNGVKRVAFSGTGTALALELSCDCGTPWSGAGNLFLPDSNVDDAKESQTPTLERDGVTVTGWSTDGRITGQNAVSDWTPQATIDGYAVPDERNPAENLTMSNPGFDPLTGEAATAPPAAMQTGPIEWNRGGATLDRSQGAEGSLEYLYELYVFGDGPVPNRGFATRSTTMARKTGTLTPAASPIQHIGSAAGWFVAPRWLDDGRLAYVEAAPGPAALMVLKSAVVEGGAELPLEGLASAVAFSPTGHRLAIVEAAVGADDHLRMVDVP